MVIVRTVEELSAYCTSKGFDALTRSVGIIGVEFGHEPRDDDHLDKESYGMK